MQNVPDRFDILVLIGNIGRFQVHPVTDTIGHLFPFLDVCESGFAAQFIELLNAVIFDLLFVGEAELLFYFDLHRQAVRIPSAAA
ncbi:hypothetical protein SDC9_173165 [bioreactor metagenome]|uniref:Uncharacterized protein n=1 Tax=bioreactor metagenome TaxID=1076179 RepID=A0A645GHV8_9ZZZZ